MISSTMPFGEILLLRVATKVGERQHCDRRLVGERQWRRFSRGLNASLHCHPEDPYWARNVLELLLAQVPEGDIELARGVLLYPRRHADPSRLCQTFEPSRDIHAIAEDVPVLNNDVALMDADAELDPIVGRNRLIAVGHTGLHLGRAAQRVHDTAELDQKPVACRLDEPAVTRGNGRIDQLRPDSPKPCENGVFILPHEAGIPSHVGGEDRGEAAGRGHG